MEITGKQLLEMVSSGAKPVVEFTKECDRFDYESFDTGMRARLTSVWTDVELDCLGCQFDIAEFEGFNKSVERPVWYGKNGEMVTWSESPYYPEDKKVTIYIGEDECPGFEIIEESVAFLDYKMSGSKLSYVQWLEEQYLKNRWEVL